MDARDILGIAFKDHVQNVMPKADIGRKGRGIPIPVFQTYLGSEAIAVYTLKHRDTDQATLRVGVGQQKSRLPVIVAEVTHSKSHPPTPLELAEQLQPQLNSAMDAWRAAPEHYHPSTKIRTHHVKVFPDRGAQEERLTKIFNDNARAIGVPVRKLLRDPEQHHRIGEIILATAEKYLSCLADKEYEASSLLLEDSVLQLTITGTQQCTGLRVRVLEEGFDLRDYENATQLRNEVTYRLIGSEQANNSTPEEFSLKRKP